MIRSGFVVGVFPQVSQPVRVVVEDRVFHHKNHRISQITVLTFRRVRGSEGQRTTGEFPKLPRYPFSLIKWRRLASSSGRGRFYLYPRGTLIIQYLRTKVKLSCKVVIGGKGCGL